MKTTSHQVNLQYTRQELEALFVLANREDVEGGGRYDARSGAINVWSHHWANEATRHDSDTIGTFYVHWADENCIYEMECDEGFALGDLLVELGVLELKAFGTVKHGRGGSETLP